MYDFVVGGYLPGTNIQLSLQAWIAIADILFGFISIYYLEMRQQLAKQVAQSARQPLPASSLHHRQQLMAPVTGHTVEALLAETSAAYSRSAQKVLAAWNNSALAGWLDRLPLA